MNLSIIAVGKKQPTWINQGFEEYAKRLQQECKLRLIEVASISQSKSLSAESIKTKEAKLIDGYIPKHDRLVAMDEQGKSLSSQGLAEQLENWLAAGVNVSFLIGGAEGLAPEIKSRADECWSLSAFTLPHGLARVMLAEQLYRAWTILKCHPYHRS